MTRISTKVGKDRDAPYVTVESGFEIMCDNTDEARIATTAQGRKEVEADITKQMTELIASLRESQ
jgi:hypothetical protein